MSVRFLITSAALLAIAGPAFADCNQEVERLSEAVTQAETGASTDAAMPATPHQEEVLVHRSRQKIHSSLAAHDTLPRFRRCQGADTVNLLNASVH